MKSFSFFFWTVQSDLENNNIEAEENNHKKRKKNNLLLFNISKLSISQEA